MPKPTDDPTRRYLGDGVYASFDGWQVWLTTDRLEGQHSIALEPSVFADLMKYVYGRDICLQIAPILAANQAKHVPGVTP